MKRKDKLVFGPETFSLDEAETFNLDKRERYPTGLLMKKCNKCRIDKEILEFPKNKTKSDGYSNICKKCNTQIVKEFYKKNKEKYKEILKARCARYLEKIRKEINSIKANKGCINCREKEPICLDFHHPNKLDKIDDVSQLVRKKSYKKAIIELEKCIVICSNCHRKLHAGVIKLDGLESLKRDEIDS